MCCLVNFWLAASVTGSLILFNEIKIQKPIPCTLPVPIISLDWAVLCAQVNELALSVAKSI